MALTSFQMKKVEGPKVKPAVKNETFQRIKNCFTQMFIRYMLQICC